MTKDISFENFETPTGRFDAVVKVNPINAAPSSDPKALDLWFSQEILPAPINAVHCDPVEDPVSFAQFGRQNIGDCFLGLVSEEKLPQVNNIKSQMAAFFNQPQPSQLPAKAISEFEKEPLGLAIAEIENKIATDGSFAVIDNLLCRYKSPCWKSLSDKEMAQAEVRSWLSEKFATEITLRPRYIKEIVEGLRTDPRIFLDSNNFLSRKLLINCADGIYNIVSGKVMPTSPTYGFFNYIDISAYKIGIGMHSYFDEFIHTAFSDDPNSRRLSLEIIGIIISNLNLKKFFLCLGDSHTGKSQFGIFIQKLIGDKSMVSLSSIDDFASTWTTSTLVGKRLCTCLDLPDTYLPLRVMSTIKQIVGDDAIRGEQKYHNPITFYPDTVLLFASNHPLKVPNAASEKAFLNRLSVLPFCNPIPESQQIQNLYLKLLDEAPYIIGQAANAVRDLARRNYVLTIALPVQKAIHFPDLSVAFDSEKNIACFIESRCSLESASKISTASLYQAYCAYCDKLNLQPVNQIDFARRLFSLYPSLKSLKRIEGEERRGVQGIALRANADD
ncbi:MAG: DUF5906 domain-containing protein [Clostridiaceae bacterium]|nr:DUF5906 domain-containing protein [Clostridiaceae bacterium]